MEDQVALGCDCGWIDLRDQLDANRPEFALGIEVPPARVDWVIPDRCLQIDGLGPRRNNVEEDLFQDR